MQPVEQSPEPSRSELSEITADFIQSSNIENAIYGKDIALNFQDGYLITDFTNLFRSSVVQCSTVVFSDNSIIQREINRQLSGNVDDSEAIKIGHQKGAEIVLNLDLYKLPGTEMIDIKLIAANISLNTLTLEYSKHYQCPLGFDIEYVREQNETRKGTMKRIVGDIFAQNDQGIYTQSTRNVSITGIGPSHIEIPQHTLDLHINRYKYDEINPQKINYYKIDVSNMHSICIYSKQYTQYYADIWLTVYDGNGDSIANTDDGFPCTINIPNRYNGYIYLRVNSYNDNSIGSYHIGYSRNAYSEPRG